MKLKRCPFCLGEPNSHHDEQGNFLIYCPKCMRNNITVKVMDKDKETCENKWNTRALDTYLKNNYEQVYEEMALYNKEGLSDNDVLRVNETNKGYYVLPEGEVLRCDDDHINTLLKLLGYNHIQADGITSETFSNFKVIRISVHDKCLMVSFNPDKVTKKMITECIFLLTGIVTTNLVKYYLNLIDQDFTYDTLNELILKLDSIK